MTVHFVNETLSNVFCPNKGRLLFQMESNFAFFCTKQIWWIRKRNVTNRFDLSDTPVTTCRPAGLLFADEYTVNQRRGNAASTSGCTQHSQLHLHRMFSRLVRKRTLRSFPLLSSTTEGIMPTLTDCLCVCLSVNRITQKVSGEFGRNFLGR